ncbi:MAG: acetate/propionate family kinase [Thiobacillaceae bacterium]
MNEAVLVLNAGSSSIKFALYQVAEAKPAPLLRGSVEEIGGSSRLRLCAAPDAARDGPPYPPVADHAEALAALLDWLAPHLAGVNLLGAGHRVVHGGSRYTQPVRVDAQLLTYLDTLVPIDPLHQPHNLAGIRALLELRPDLPQVACFDTAFHHTLPAVAQRFALPQALFAAGVRRYGFHGLSYEYIAGVLPHYLGAAADGRVIVAHLGNGASLCALKGRQSVETTMSFTPLDGLPMGSRCGALDPAIPLYLMRERGMDVDQVSDLLHRQSGLKGMSGISSDMRTLLASTDPRAGQAVAHFVYHVAQGIGALAMSLGGLDALVFTAGIGAHAAPVRADVCRSCAWLGLELDAAANSAHGPRISTPQSVVSAWVIPTDEEVLIARRTLEVLGAAGCGSARAPKQR